MRSPALRKSSMGDVCAMRVFTRKLLPCRQIESYSVIHLGERKVFLNPSGTGIWNLIDGEKTTDEIALDVAQQLNAPAEKVAGKVTTFLESLRSEEHTSELQSQSNLVCRLLLEKKKKKKKH